VETIEIDGKGGRHTEVINAFVAAILGNGSLIAEASEGRASVSLANAIILSSELDRTVELPLDPAAFEQWLAGKRESSTFDPGAASSGGVADMNASFSS
jgi:hypothetical protein